MENLDYDTYKRGFDPGKETLLRSNRPAKLISESTPGGLGFEKFAETNTPMIDRAMRQINPDIGRGKSMYQYLDEELDKALLPQPQSLLATIERSLKDIYEWACENQKDNQGLLYDLNTAIAAVERCGVKIKDGRS